MDRNELFELESRGLSATGQLSPQPWLSSPATNMIFDALEAGGAQTRFVGGCVRDALANRKIKDIDIATTCDPDRSMELLIAAGIKTIPTGIEHGTVMAVIGGDCYHITTLRKDVKTDGRHAVVAYTDSWFADARRRDFTINAMSATRAGDVYDPYNGISDLSHGRITFIGNPSHRIAEDYLRILRFFRFQTTHGNPPADRAALMACRLAAEKLQTLSADRIRDEMMKILSADGLPETVILMRGEKVLDQVLPEAENVGRVRALIWLTTRAIQMDGVSIDPVRNLMALLAKDVSEEVIDGIATRWKLSNADRRRLHDMRQPLGTDPEEPQNEMDQYLYSRHPAHVLDQALLAWAGEASSEPRLPRTRTEAWINLVERIITWKRPVFPLSGKDIVGMGVPPGPEVGRVLNETEAWWVDEGFTPNASACLEHATSRFGERDNP